MIFLKKNGIKLIMKSATVNGNENAIWKIAQ